MDQQGEHRLWNGGEMGLSDAQSWQLGFLSTIVDAAKTA